ncbi:MAG TPA: sensor histidine kinase [Verrucomicrobiae bacterium]
MPLLLLILGLAGIFPAGSRLIQAAETSGSLTNVAQIRNLSAAETARRQPVQLTGIMLDTAKTDPNWRAIIFADPTACIYIVALPATSGKNIFDAFHRGDLLAIKGTTGPGQFAPIVVATAAKKIGTAPIPKALPTTYQQLITGALDGQWVQIKGVVRQVFGSEPDSDLKRLVMAVDGGLVQVVYAPNPKAPIEVDAEVNAQAVCFYQFNQKRQVLRPVLQVPRDAPLIVEKPAPADPFAAPVRSPTSLLTFSPDNLHAYSHRVHIRGIVTFAQKDSFVWIRAENTGLRIQTSQPDHLSPGDKIDALGFPTFGFNTPQLEDAIFRQAGSTNPPLPVTLNNFDDAFNHEDDLVVVEGTLTQVQPFLNGVTLTLNKNNQLFKAVLKISNAEPAYPDWQTGAKVRIAGICTLIHDDPQPAAGIWQPKSFQILLRATDDLVILQPSPWWTPQHIVQLLEISTGTLALMIGAIMLISRQRLRQQQQQRQRAEAEFAAILSERNRLAREIHDTLAQGLTATSVQLRLAKKQIGAAGIVNRHLDTAQTLVSDSLTEARSSIWNMRSHILETGGLVGALKGILIQMADGTETTTQFEVTGRSRPLAPVIENNVLRIGQEAITNAIKHAGAKQIKVVLAFGEKQFQLSVTDDGGGFNPQQPPPSEGGFGLVGMRERAAELKGELAIRSVAGHGVEIMLSVPLLSGE